ncbi:MAG: MaoC family dehydratase [Acidimicrobiales bacterium]
MALTVFEGIDEVTAAVGRHLGSSDWLEITQHRIDQFADATGDHQWIHVDPARAAEGPFGTTIAHGYLTMSLSNYFLPQIVEVRGVSMGVNYGANKVRFPRRSRWVPRRQRGRPVEDIPGGIQTTMVVTIERQEPTAGPSQAGLRHRSRAASCREPSPIPSTSRRSSPMPVSTASRPCPGVARPRRHRGRRVRGLRARGGRTTRRRRHGGRAHSMPPVVAR